MRDRIICARLYYTDYEASVHLLQTIQPTEWRLAHTIFDELLEVDSYGGWDIDYERFECRLVRTWRHQLSFQTEARRLQFEVEIYKNLARIYLNWVAERRELTHHMIEKAGDNDPDEEQMGWTDVIYDQKRQDLSDGTKFVTYPHWILLET